METQLKSKKWILLGAFLCAILSASLLPLVGEIRISLSEIFKEGSLASKIYWDIRLPRTLLAFFAGGALAVCGMGFQAIFHNPLATPFTLGVSSGAALGASIFFLFGASLPFFNPSLGAFGGGIFAAIVALLLALRRNTLSIHLLLLTGVIMNFFFSSLVLFMQYISEPSQVLEIMRWLSGSLSGATFSPLYAVIPSSVLTLAALRFYGRELDLLSVGEEYAKSRGVAVERLKWILCSLLSFCVAVTVAACGVIGFVGIVVPHVSRAVIGNRHQPLSVASFLIGGVSLMASDFIARTIVFPMELPAGIITALAGGPLFIWILWKREARRLADC